GGPGRGARRVPHAHPQRPAPPPAHPPGGPPEGPGGGRRPAGRLRARVPGGPPDGAAGRAGGAGPPRRPAPPPRPPPRRRAGAAGVGAALGRRLPLVRRVIAQAERRVLRGEAVPAAAKVVSLVEPHTAVLPRHKPGRAVESGRERWLAAANGGLVTDARVLAG